MSAAELANAILNWQSVQRPKYVVDVDTSLAGLIQQYHDAIVEECAATCDRYGTVLALKSERRQVLKAAAEIRLLKGCT